APCPAGPPSPRLRKRLLPSAAAALIFLLYRGRYARAHAAYARLRARAHAAHARAHAHAAQARARAQAARRRLVARVVPARMYQGGVAKNATSRLRRQFRGVATSRSDRWP